MALWSTLLTFRRGSPVPHQLRETSITEDVLFSNWLAKFPLMSLSTIEAPVTVAVAPLNRMPNVRFSVMKLLRMV